jgi:hypothetical protein
VSLPNKKFLPIDLKSLSENLSSALQMQRWHQGVEVKKLGLVYQDHRLMWVGVENQLPITGAFLVELLLWVPYLAALQTAKLVQSFAQTNSPTLNIGLKKPGGWYMLMGAAAWGGIKTVRYSSFDAQAVYFEDLTMASDSTKIPEDAINGRCVDIRKSHVAKVFEQVFGYPLAIDPMTYHGMIVKKPETNGGHDGCLLMAPISPVTDFVYQKLIDTADANGLCNDLRTPCMGGKPVLVWRKQKQADRRFGIQNLRATLHKVDDIYSADEVRLIEQFNEAIGLECGGLDILRDTKDGRIYIVDANKTDMGPLIALSWRDKMASMKLLGAALRSWLIDRRGDQQSESKR